MLKRVKGQGLSEIERILNEYDLKKTNTGEYRIIVEIEK